jgi:hypothetical protein
MMSFDITPIADEYYCLLSAEDIPTASFLSCKTEIRVDHLKTHDKFSTNDKFSQ